MLNFLPYYVIYSNLIHFHLLSCSSEKINCPASITLRLGPKKDRLVVSQAILEHNHNLSEVEFAHHFKRHQLRASLGLPIRITNSISKRFMVPDLIWKLEYYSKAKDKGICELLDVLDRLFKADAGAKVKLVFQEDAAILNSIFLATSCMRKLVQRFPACLFLERAACLDADFELYTVLCQDANGRGREVAYCLARQGMPDLLIFIVASLVQSAPDIKLQVKVVTVGAGVTGLDAVEEVLPCAQVQICRLQVLEALYRKAHELAVAKEDQIHNILLNLANADSPWVYNQYLSYLEDVAPLSFLQYFLERWHPHKSMWVECWAFEKNYECPFLDHFSTHRHKLLTALNPPMVLAACVQVLLDLQVLHVETSILNVAPVIELYRATCQPDSADLVAEELDLVPHAHYTLKETSDGYLLEGSTCSFLVSQNLATCSCSIYTVHQQPCRHIFTARLWVGEPLFDCSLLPLGLSGKHQSITEQGEC